ncbi:MAG: hypothetical protein D6767_07605 [Candidatus Hydrogenedentota bacterium]|nr:MAG: hypothetical protein D6767_07605 [Candidatus Hydrogenedentota bacterium]
MEKTKEGLFKKISVFFFLILFAGSHFISAEPASQKAKKKRGEILSYLMFLATPMANFGTDEEKKQFEQIKKDYTGALAFFLEGNYVESYRSFVEVQKEVEKLTEKVSANYIARTQTMLEGLINEMLDLDIRYDKNSQFMKMVMRDLNPEIEKRPYDPKEVHYSYDKYHIMNTLRMGYAKLGKAKKIRQDAINLEKWLEKGKELPPRLVKKRIESYLGVINLCREAKLNAIYAYQLFNLHVEGKSLLEVQKRFLNNPYLVEKRLDPVFDPRIPEEYVVDANDALNRLHQDEVRVKINGEILSNSNKKKNTKK